MSINGIFNQYDSYRFGFGYVDSIQKLRAVAPARNKLFTPDHRDRLTSSVQYAMRMRKALEALRTMTNESEEIQRVSPASASSVSSLGLDTTETPTTVQSVEEINTTPTSFSTHGPEFTGSSTAQASISGEYDGSNGTDTLTFKVSAGGTDGVDKLQIRVLDSSHNPIDNFNINKNDAIDKQYSLNNGLVFSLGEGDIVANDTFTLSVDDSVPTSYSPSEPDWAGSTASATVAGVYDGSNGSDTLTFKVTAGGAHGQDDLQITVFDSGSNQIDQINIDSKDSIDQAYTLSNGLTLTLGEGDLLVDSSFRVDVFDSVGTAVDPDNPFNGSRGDDPNLEDGLSISDGSFEINGTTIDVNASDSVNTVLDSITQSDANVTATFDAVTEKVLLTQKTTGEGQDIVLENDTSGFLAAVKLDLAMPTPGEDPETEKPLAEVGSFSSVQNGSITVNAVAIDIDVNTDSLTDVLDRISDSSAEVSASFNSSSQRVTLNADDPDSQLTLASGETNFFAALGIADGTYNSENDLIRAGDIEVVDSSNLIAEYVKTYRTYNSAQNAETQTAKTVDAEMAGTLVHLIAKSMNALFDNSALSSSPTTKTEEIRNNVRNAISASFNSDEPQFKTDFGIHFDFQKTEKGVFDFSQADQHQFETALTNPEGESAVRNALFGKEPGGLFKNLHAALTTGVPELASEAGATGIFLDVTA